MTARLLSALVLLFMTPMALASNSFSCNIKDLSTTMSAPKYLIVHMECDSTSPIAPGSNGCTSSTVLRNAFTFDATSEQGKLNASLVLMAFATKKRVYASTYGTCPKGLENTPLLYGLKVYGS
ncbi:hypothetical protein [Pseudoalteromonas luteoviolacea]|uniref:Spore coat protein U domain-containing protein n=1 Tax=Pseudoalteromonas luteoviolacea DSM 6061 TaxID=1365250 RepID=A0A166V2M0_9GAMM|nr:hypothetical protein [Pseudoalteromonas luteoviolacea]KZN31648.1 hypothetical protein N475_04135 [Pseudoalteromonas luteoviolacea DSM 6061]MBE0388981.1 hypothetical protein [Pseudoalteromonas luteoviolacea DSM 6061]TQF70345.1 hypothetical protein FLM44_04415 [Pseudoalteromonas luteoviolacea]